MPERNRKALSGLPESAADEDLDRNAVHVQLREPVVTRRVDGHHQQVEVAAQRDEPGLAGRALHQDRLDLLRPAPLADCSVHERSDRRPICCAHRFTHR